MTNDEVALIYGYLHENYRYEDGDLIAIKSRQAHRIGTKLGYLRYSDKMKVECLLNIDGVRFHIGLHQLVFLFHFKKYIKYIGYKDKNKMNLRIDNLYQSSVDEIRFNQSHKTKKYDVTRPSKMGDRFPTRIKINKKTLFLGSWPSQELATEVYNKAKQLRIEGLDPIDIKKNIIKLYPENKMKIGNKSGFTGVHPSKTGFNAQLYINGKNKHLGCFNTPEEAHQAYLQAKQEYANDSR